LFNGLGERAVRVLREDDFAIEERKQRQREG